MLIPFPFAFLAGVVLFNGIGVITGRASFWTTADHLTIAGIVAAVAAAIPGLVDYVFTVPPRSTGKTRAMKHMTLNLAAVALFALSVGLRGDPATAPPPAALAVQVVALSLLGTGAWMGGTLMIRNQVGVDHRYANAGKWSEASVATRPGAPRVVAAADELQINQMKLLHVDGKRIVLGRTEDGWVAFDDRCTHRGGSLADGVLICGTVQCAWHGSQFNAATGAVERGPAAENISVYRAEQAGQAIHLTMR